MSNLIQHLQSLWLSLKQAELFCAVTKYGAKPASFFAKILKTERTNTYKTAITLVEKWILGQSDQNGTTIFFVPDKEVFRKKMLFAQRKIEEQEKILPELEQELLQLEQAHSSPIPKMRFYQGISWIESLFDHMIAHILQSGLLQIKCFATNTITSQGYNTSFAHIQETFTKTLYEHHIWVDLILANGISLLEDLVRSHDSTIMKELPTGNNALHLYIIQHTLYICIYKSIPVGIHIESEELAEVIHFMMKHCS